MYLPHFEISTLQEYNDIIYKYQISMIFLHAPWCKPCQEFKPTLYQYFENLKYPNTCIIAIDYDKLKMDELFMNIFKGTMLPGFYIYNMGEYSKPIISVDLRFIEPFVNDKMNEIFSKNKISIQDDF